MDRYDICIYIYIYNDVQYIKQNYMYIEQNYMYVYIYIHMHIYIWTCHGILVYLDYKGMGQTWAPESLDGEYYLNGLDAICGPSGRKF